MANRLPVINGLWYKGLGYSQFEGHQNCIICSKVLAVLTNRWILPIIEVASVGSAPADLANKFSLIKYEIIYLYSFCLLRVWEEEGDRRKWLEARINRRNKREMKIG